MMMQYAIRQRHHHRVSIHPAMVINFDVKIELRHCKNFLKLEFKRHTMEPPTQLIEATSCVEQSSATMKDETEELS